MKWYAVLATVNKDNGYVIYAESHMFFVEARNYEEAVDIGYTKMKKKFPEQSWKIDIQALECPTNKEASLDK